MHAVVNQLRFADDVDPAIFTSMDDVMSQMRAIEGFVGVQVLQTSAKEVVRQLHARDRGLKLAKQLRLLVLVA